MDAVSDLLREALIVASMLSFPVLLTATIVGTMIAILQAATQVQEQTLSALPKIAAVMVIIALFGPFGMSMCAHLLTDAIGSIHLLLMS